MHLAQFAVPKAEGVLDQETHQKNAGGPGGPTGSASQQKPLAKILEKT